MIIDTTNLNRDDTVLLNAVANRLRYQYIQNVTKLGASLADKRLYSIPFFAKNSAVCPVFFSVVYFFFLKEKLLKGNIGKVVIHSRYLSNAILRLAEDNSIKVVVNNRDLFSPYIVPCLSILKLLLWWVYERVAFNLIGEKVCLGIASSHKSEKPKLILETIFYAHANGADSESKDRHFADSAVIFGDKFGYQVLVFPLFYGFFNYFSVFKALKRKGLHVVSLASLFNLRLLIVEVKKTLSFQKPNFIFSIDDVEFTDVAHRSILTYRWKMSSILARLKYSALSAINVGGESDHRFHIIRWYEGHEFDCMSILGWRKSGLATSLFGYFDSYPPVNYLCPYVTPSLIDSGVLPDHFFVVNKSIKDALDLSGETRILEHTSSIRLSAYTNRNPNVEPLESKVFLIPLPLSRSQSAFIEKLVNETIEAVDDIDFKIVLRPHPASAKKVRIFNKHVVVDTKSPFSELLSKASGVVGSGSTAIVEALVCGKTVGIVNFPGELSASPVTINALDERVFGIYTTDDLQAFFVSNCKIYKKSERLDVEAGGVDHLCSHIDDLINVKYR